MHTKYEEKKKKKFPPKQPLSHHIELFKRSTNMCVLCWKIPYFRHFKQNNVIIKKNKGKGSYNNNNK